MTTGDRLCIAQTAARADGDWKSSDLLDVLTSIADERDRQDTRWGEQNHQDGTDVSYYDNLDDARETNKYNNRHGFNTWADILLEEVFEALVETDDDPAKLREELVQVAAVATAWIEAIDRRTT